MHKELNTQREVQQHIKDHRALIRVAFQGVDLSSMEAELATVRIHDCIFLGCALSLTQTDVYNKHNLIFPNLDVPFATHPNALYSARTLMAGYQLGLPESYQNTLDKKVYDHYLKYGTESKSIMETLARRLHDHSITDALYDFLENYEERRVVAMMGGHNLLRSDNDFHTVARISKVLTEQGYLMISGGGPGAMEATHVGAWFANKTDSELQGALNILAEASSYKDPYWLDKAFTVLNQYPNSSGSSLGIPTWLYGHEPPTPFASHIAKYFANSVREEGLLAIAKGGVIFAPGSAGTIQEIFQDATQNHYSSYGFPSPMVFLNRNYWTSSRPIYPLLSQMAEEGKYNNLMLSLCDEVSDIVDAIISFSSS